MTINPKIFKAYDIRGIYNQDFKDHFAYLLGLAFVALRKNDPDYSNNKQLKIVVGRDMRLSSPILKKELIKGLTAAGAKVVDIDLVSTPSFYFAVSKYNSDGGIMISASHNPKEWNGFKLVRNKGVAVSGESGIKFLQKIILENKLKPSKKLGIVIKKSGILDEEIKNAFKYVASDDIKKLNIVADAANGMGALYLNKLFSQLNVKVKKLNFNLDGSFPVHEADPSKKENLIEISKTIIREKADLGIATDGDGDRIFFIDNKGQIISPAIIRGLLAKIFLQDKPGSKIGYDVRPGKITTDLISANHGQAIMTRVGHSLIKEQMLTENIYFAGESSGHFFLNLTIGCFEYPLIMILKLLKYFSDSNKSVSACVALYNKYFSSGEINREVDDKEAVLEKIEKKYKDAKIFKLDGISVEYKDYWFNVRSSNTENKIRLNLEAVDKRTMLKKRDEVLKLIN